MKITNKVIHTVVEDVVGPDALDIVKFIKNKKNISEFKIAESVERQINETRNILYRLYHENLVTFTRKKDKKKGWYIYYWTFNPKHITHLQSNLKNKRLEGLRERLKREESGQFFICNNKCMRLDFEQATEFEFKCAECGELMDMEDNSDKIAKIKADIALLEKKTDSNKAK